MKKNSTPSTNKKLEEIAEVTIRIAGDSGDGMQLVGQKLTDTSLLYGNDVGTLPDFPAEIRAPMGTLAGISGFQIKWGSYDIHTPGDELDALVAINPAALSLNISSLKKGGIVIVNCDTFSEKGLKLAELNSNPLTDGSLSAYRTFSVEMTTLTRKALASFDELSRKETDKCKNFFSLGMLCWLFNRDITNTIDFLKEKFKHHKQVADANATALKAGFAYCEAQEIFTTTYEVRPAKLPKGKYKSVNGNESLSLGLMAASQQANLKLFYASYPITPASETLQYLAMRKKQGVKSFQAEDEIAAVGAAIGASFAGHLGVCGTSGPGVSLMSESINLAMITELPLVIVNIQRGGPSTGLPTKTEQADLLACLFGRNGESPIPIVSANTPSDSFDAAFEAVRIAVEHMTPVYLLSDGYIANGSEPWLIPDLNALPTIVANSKFDSIKESTFQPYARNPKTLARKWPVPGIPNLMHRIGGLEKQDGSGNVNYDGSNHHKMVFLRKKKIDIINKNYPATNVYGATKGKLLVMSWGSTYGATLTAIENYLQEGNSQVGWVHLRHLNPLPADLGNIIQKYEHLFIPEINTGQLAYIIRSTYLKQIETLNVLRGQPLRVAEIEQKINEIVKK